MNQYERCSWVSDDLLYINYHDNEWGIPVYEDSLLFEFLILEGMQAGLSWITVLKKRDNFRQSFDNFNPQLMAEYGENKILALMSNAGIIRNRLKIQASITNAQAYLQIKNQTGSFADYIWSFVAGNPIKNHWEHPNQVPTSSSISDKMSKDLKKRGFKFVGTTICYAFMQAVGLVDDHTTNCFCYKNRKASK